MPQYETPEDLTLPNKGTSSLVSFRSAGGIITVPAHNLALEIVLYGDDLKGVADAYEVTTEQLIYISETNPLVRKEMEEARALLKKHGRTRMRARDMLEGALTILQSRMADEMVELKDFTKAVELLARIADVLPRPDPAAAAVTGAVLNFQVLPPPDPAMAGIKPLYAADAKDAQIIMPPEDDDIEPIYEP